MAASADRMAVNAVLNIVEGGSMARVRGCPRAVIERVTTRDYRAGMPTAGSAEVMMMLLADARLPPARTPSRPGWSRRCGAGVPASAVPAYIRARLRSVTAVEARRRRRRQGPNGQRRNGSGDGPGSGTGRRRRRAGGPERSAPRCARPRCCWAVATPGWSAASGREPPDRAALAAIGRPGGRWSSALRRRSRDSSAAQVVRLIGYDDAQTVAAATLKLEPLDPVVATGWVMAAGRRSSVWSSTWRG